MKRPGTARYIGDSIRARREYLGLSQRALSAKMGVTQNNISQHELGRRGMSVDTLLLYCEALGMQVTINGPMVWIDSEAKVGRDVG